jgi:hypothetical protein
MSEPSPPLPLRPDETLLWEGAPVPGWHQRGKSLFLMAFGAPFLVIGVALMIHSFAQLPKAATLSDAGLALFLLAFSVPFSGIGAFLVFGPFIDARSAARDVRYALTTRAAYVQRLRPFPSLRVYPILPTTALELERGKRADTVWVHARQERDSDGDLGTTKAGFENIAEGEKVFNLIRNLQEKAE